ncbi:splicing factor [Striga asiatica]|uniref:Splicing factor n=1 Tax=Striga asiatica TaxID=4170 RepID=A0A5A7QB66_STRAF|nr:splicing factor [Striga asiatica]
MRGPFAVQQALKPLHVFLSLNIVRLQESLDFLLTLPNPLLKGLDFEQGVPLGRQVSLGLIRQVSFLALEKLGVPLGSLDLGETLHGDALEIGFFFLGRDGFGPGSVGELGGPLGFLLGCATPVVELLELVELRLVFLVEVGFLLFEAGGFVFCQAGGEFGRLEFFGQPPPVLTVPSPGQPPAGPQLPSSSTSASPAQHQPDPPLPYAWTGLARTSSSTQLTHSLPSQLLSKGWTTSPRGMCT